MAFAGSLVFLGATAQPARAQVDVGLYAAPTIANYSGSYVDSSISTWGFVGGLFAEWHLSEHWSIEGSFAYGQMGAFEVESPLTSEAHDYRTVYIQLPIAVNYRTRFANDRWSLRAFAGGAPAVEVGCDVKPSTQFSFDTECSADTPGGEIESSDALVMFGIGVDRIFVGGSGLGFDARYTLGTANVLSDAEEAGLTVKNRVLDIRFRIFIPIRSPRL